MNKLRRLFGRVISILGNRGFFHNMDDGKYLKLIYPYFIGTELNLNNPITFNEKLQWLKIHNRKEEFTKMADKYAVREYIAEKIGEEYLIPLVAGPFENADQIDFDSLPNQFVLKCNHDSGSVIVCKDKNSLDINSTCKSLNRHLKNNLYYGGREWPYKNIKPLIIAEKYMVDENSDPSFIGLTDYKFYCFNGEPKFVYVSKGLGGDHRFAEISFYDLNWKPTGFIRNDFKPISTQPPKPENFDKMIELASILSKDIPFLRVDLYEINKKIYFSELTFYPSDGFVDFEPKEWNEKIGNLIDLGLVKED